MMMRRWKTAVLLLLTAPMPAYSADMMTPEETVRYYLRCMGRKDKSGMDSVVAEECRGADAELDNLKRVELLSCLKEANPPAVADLPGVDGGAPYDTALVRATFAIEYENGGGAGFDNGEYHWCFHLVKDRADGDWKIVMSGE
jgi:hypothetical protein